MKPSWRRLSGLLLVMSALILAVAACGGDDDGDGGGEAAKADTPIIVGTKNFPEQFILGELYKQALEAKGYTVSIKSNIGSTEIIDKALTSGQINFYPEYTGTSVTVVFGKEGGDSAESTYDTAKEGYEGRGQTLLAMTPFSDSDALAVRKEDADANGLKEIGDLKDFKGGAFKLGGQPEFTTRDQGLPGLEKNYELTSIDFVPFAGISPYEALDQKKVDVAAIFSTDPPLASGKYVVLEDTAAQFGFQNIAPVVAQTIVDALGSEFEDTVNAVSEKLTEEAIIAMNSAVAIDQQQPADVAKQFLEENDLL